MSPPKVYITILQYNNSEDTLKCLDSVFKVQYPDLEVVIVDNNSRPEHLDNIKNYIENQPSTHPMSLISNPKNLGYSGGNNVGIKYAIKGDADYIFILNNDTIIEKDVLEKLVKIGESDPKIGILTPSIREGDETVYGGKIKWLKTELRHLKEYNSNPDYIPGSAMLIKREVIEKIGLLDERYFLYFEDADYSLRVKKAGYKLVVVPEAMVEHKVSSSTKQFGSPLILRYHMRNSLLFNLNHAPPAYKTLLHFWAFGLGAKQIIKIVSRIHPRRSRAILAGIKDFYKEKWGYIDPSRNIIKVAIECHKLESPSANERAGIGRTLYKFFEEIDRHPELKDKFKFYLYFKGFIPDIPFLENKIFVKKIAKLPFFIPFFRPSFNIFFHIALPFFCWKDKVDVTFFPSFIMPAFFVGKSIAVLTNDVYYEYTKGTLPLKFKISYRLFANRAARQATYITPFTNYAKREIIKCFKLKPEKVEVVPLGIDSEQIMSYADRNKVKNKNYILYVGQAFPRRHLKETILAFEKIAHEFPDLNLIAIGHDKYNPPIIKNLVAQVNKNLGKEKIFYRKSVNDDELLRLYFEAQLFLYISSSEAMGLPPIEALAANTPAVVADDPLTHEIFGDNAFFVKNPDDVDSIARTIKEALNDKDKKIKIVNNKDKVLSKYTWPIHTKQMLDIFKKVALDRY